MPLDCVIMNDGPDRSAQLRDFQPKGRSAAGKLLDLIEAMVDGGTSGLTTMEIATSAGLDKTTASRLLAELSERNWVARDAESRRYRPGEVFLRAVRTAADPKNLNVIIYPLLNGLRDASGESATFNKRVDRVQVIVAAVESNQKLRRGVEMGDVTPLSRGPVGRTMLAYCPQDYTDELLNELPVDERQIASDLLPLIRRQHYLSWESASPAIGEGIISAPVFSNGSEIYGALALSGPSARFDKSAREKVAHLLMDAAATVTDALGGRVPPQN